jgi:hypothetical protein
MLISQIQSSQFAIAHTLLDIMCGSRCTYVNYQADDVCEYPAT